MGSEAGHVYVVPAEDWSSMTPEEFEAKAMAGETRRIVQIPGDGTIDEILTFVNANCG